ncbi:MAG: tetratricopeptide repeat protein [candidate division Zixibacteria bacterium]
MRRLTLITLLLLSLIILFSQSIWALGSEMEKAILDARWPKIYKMLKADSASVADPISRLLMGHACLATQKNYGATSMFKSVTDPDEIVIWAQFTESFYKQHPENAVAVYLSADANLRLGKIEDALAGFDHSISRNDLFLLPYYQKAFIYNFMLKDYQKAETEFRNVLRINPRFARAYLELAGIYTDRDDHTKSIELLSKAIDSDKEYSFAFYNRANAYMHLKDYDKALSDYDQAIMLRPIWPEAFYNRGNLFLFGKDNLLNAISDYDKAIRMNPEYSDAYLNRGIARDRQGMSPQAISDFNRVLDLSPDKAEAYSNRGNAHLNMDLIDKALDDYNKALELNPQLAEAFENRGYLYMVKLNDPEKACADWKKACQLGRCNNYNIARDGGTCK